MSKRKFFEKRKIKINSYATFYFATIASNNLITNYEVPQDGLSKALCSGLSGARAPVLLHKWPLSLTMKFAGTQSPCFTKVIGVPKGAISAYLAYKNKINTLT